MPPPDIIEQIKLERRDKASPTVILPKFARLYSQQIRLLLRQPPLANFTDRDRDQFYSEAVGLLHGALLERQLGSGGSDWKDGAKRAGEIFEWLIPLYEEGATTPPTTLLAALAYRVAGYPAMAESVVVRPTSAVYSGMLVALLRGDTSDLLKRIVQYWSEDPLRVIEQPEAVDLSREAVRCLGVFGAFLMWGEGHLVDRALLKLRRLATAMLYSQVDHAWLVALATTVVVDECWENSLRKVIVPLVKVVSEAEPLERYVRLSCLERRAIAWPAQRKGIEQIASGASFVLATPTGTGKTSVAELAIITELLSNNRTMDAPLAIYVVPSKALASEVEARLSRTLRSIAKGKITVTGLYGGTDWGPTDAWLTSENPTVVVCTFEKAEALLRHLSAWLMVRLRLLVVDELHTVLLREGVVKSWAENRELRLESLIARIRATMSALGNSCRIVGLSAVAGGAERQLAQWFSADRKGEPVRGAQRSTRQILGRIETLPNGYYRIVYDLLDRVEVHVDERRREQPFIPNPFPRRPAAPSSDKGGSLVVCRAEIMWPALQLAAVEGHSRTSVLLFVADRIEQFAAGALILLEEDWEGMTPNIFTEPRSGPDAILWRECLATCEDYFTKQSTEYQLLLRGIVVHHGKMPLPMARRFKVLVERRIVRLVIATSTLSEGVNLPVEYVLIPYLIRNGHGIVASEIDNLMGRAGRPGVATEGKVLVLFGNRPDDKFTQSHQAHYFALVSRFSGRTSNRDNVESAAGALIKSIHAAWRSITDDKLPFESFLDWLESQGDPAVGSRDISQDGTTAEAIDALDSLVLAAMEEAKLSGISSSPTRTEIETVMKRVWKDLFCSLFSKKEGHGERILLARGAATLRLFPTDVERRRIYRTGLPPRAGRKLIELVPEGRAILAAGTAYRNWTELERCSFIASFVGLLRAVPNYGSKEGVSAGRKRVPWQDILRWWLAPHVAQTQPSAASISSWYNFVSSEFMYRAAWGVGGFMGVVFESLDAGGDPIVLSLDRWPESGLPWVAFWIKELLTWGTHDPVEAYALAKGYVVTRREARELSRQYYSATAGDESDPFDPRLIRDWFSMRMESRSLGSPEAALRGGINRVRLSREKSEYAVVHLRVFPILDEDGSVSWRDFAGHEVATQSASEGGLAYDAAYEYILKVESSCVTVQPYV